MSLDCFDVMTVMPLHRLFISYFVADWDSRGRVITQTRGRAFQTRVRASSFLLNPQKIGRVFQKHGRIF